MFKDMKIVAIFFILSITRVKSEDYIETPDGEIPIDEVSTYPGNRHVSAKNIQMENILLLIVLILFGQF